MVSYMFTQIKRIIFLTLITLFLITPTSNIVTANELPIIGEDLTLADIAYSQDEINEFNQQLLNDKEKLKKFYEQQNRKETENLSDNMAFMDVFTASMPLDSASSMHPKTLLGMLYQINNNITEQNASLVAFLFYDATVNPNTLNDVKITLRSYIIDALVPQTHLSINDEKRMYYWLTKAAKDNSTFSTFAAWTLGTKYFTECNNYPNNRRLQKLARDYLTQAVNNGMSDAGLFLGLYYETYENAQTEAAKWMKVAAEADDPIAAGQLGRMYTWGQGVPTDYKKAFYWAKKGADAGDPNSMTILGILYEKGWGTKVNTKKALSYYSKSCELGYDGGCNNYNGLYRKLN